jgi:hypothetical protein
VKEAQADSPDSTNNRLVQAQHRLEWNTQYSFNGLLTGLGYTYAKPRHEWTVALRFPVVMVSQSEYMGTGGFLSYRKLFPMASPSWMMTADVAYGNLLRGSASPVDERKGLYHLHEAYVGYGWQWRTSRICIGNTIGYGYYVETQTNFYNSEPLRAFGHGAQIKLWLGYAF